MNCKSVGIYECIYCHLGKDAAIDVCIIASWTKFFKNYEDKFDLISIIQGYDRKFFPHIRKALELSHPEQVKLFDTILLLG